MSSHEKLDLRCCFQPVRLHRLAGRILLNIQELLLEAEETIGGVINASGIPQKLLGHTKAIVMFPNLVKKAMIAWARVGKGVVIVRSPKTGKWNPPAFIKSRQASWGIQAGI